MKISFFVLTFLSIFLHLISVFSCFWLIYLSSLYYIPYRKMMDWQYLWQHSMQHLLFLHYHIFTNKESFSVIWSPRILCWIIQATWEVRSKRMHYFCSLKIYFFIWLPCLIDTENRVNKKVCSFLFFITD